MWPTDGTYLLLFAGLLPLGYSIVRLFRTGVREGLLSLDFAGVVAIWFGYHLSPWLAFLADGRWSDFLLLPEHIDTGLAFTTACMWCFIAGARWTAWRLGTSVAPLPTALRGGVKTRHVLLMAAASLVILAVLAGGAGEIWSTARGRGEGQFDPRDAVTRIIRMLTVASAVLNLALVTIGAFRAAEARLLSLRYLGGVACVLIGSLSFFWSFSRGAGVGFLIFALATLSKKRQLALPLGAFYLAIGIHLGFTGLSARANYKQGVGNFLAAAFSSDVVESDRRSTLPGPHENLIDAMAPFTRKIDSAPRDVSLAMSATFLWNLNPLPSELVALGRTGEDLTETMGTVGSTGITTPALAELFWVFGYGGALFCVALGAGYGWFQAYFRRKRGPTAYLVLVLCLVSYPVGLHSSMRAMTRPLVYSSIACMLAYVAERARRKKTSNLQPLAYEQR